jgi:t-SNARE complex subunit (syntaxin)
MSEDTRVLLDDFVPITYGSIVVLYNATHKTYFCAEALGGISANRKNVGEWEQFVIEKAPDPSDDNQISSTKEQRCTHFGDPVCYNDKIHLRSNYRGKYISSKSMGTLNCSKDQPKNGETFLIIVGEDPQDKNVDMSFVPIMNGSVISLLSYAYHKFVVATKLGLAFCNRTDRGSWERFVIKLKKRYPLKEHLKRTVKTIRNVEGDDIDLSRVTSTQKKQNMPFEEEKDVVVVPLRRSEDITINDTDDAAKYIEKLYRKINDIKKMIKKMSSMTSDMDRDRQLDLIRNEMISAESIEKSLQKYFHQNKKKFSENLHLERLHKQFITAKDTYLSDVVDNRDLKNAHSERNSRRKSEHVRHNSSDEDDIDLQLKQQLQMPKMKLGQADQYTLEVEKSVALETYNYVKNLESDFNDINALMLDMNEMLKEQDPLFDTISANINDADFAVQRGTSNIRDTKKMMRPF